MPSDETRGRNAANRKIAFVAHAIVCGLGCFLIFFVGGPFIGTIVLIAWSIALFCHGFFAVLAPRLRATWTERELARLRPSLDAARGEAESRHARALAELSAAIAHEIRNPVTAAKSLVQQIAEDPAAKENAEYASVAIEELDRVERSIVHLLRFAREEPRQIARASLQEVADAAVQRLKERIAEHDVTVSVDVTEAGSADVDAEQLRRVLCNVIGNAVDALVESGTPGPRIDVRGGRNLAMTEAWVTVTDNGPGIPEDALEKIFTPFYTGKASGTGLGLAISKKLVEEHGGSLEARNGASRGAQFVITLPLTAAGP